MPNNSDLGFSQRPASALTHPRPFSSARVNAAAWAILAGVVVFGVFLLQSWQWTPDVLIAWCIAGGLGVCGLVYICATTAPLEARFLVGLFLGAYMARLLVSFAIFTLDHGGIFLYDQGAYWGIGQQWADFWRHDAVSPPVIAIDAVQAYSLWVGALDYLFGDARFVPCVTNCFLGALIAVQLYKIARDHFGGEAVGRRAGLIAAVVPAMIIWSALNMRDTFAIFFITLTLRELTGLTKRFQFMSVVRLALWCVGIYLFRSYVLSMVAVAAMLTIVLTTVRHPVLRLGALAVAAVAAVLLFQLAGLDLLIGQFLEGKTEELSSARQVLAYGNTAYLTDVRFTSLSDLIVFIPLATLYFVGGPFLWMFHGLQIVILIPELIAWYSLLFLAVRGWYRLSRAKNSAVTPVASFLIVGIVLYSVVSGNFGTAIRHRTQVTPALVLLAAVGWPKKSGGRSVSETAPEPQ